MGKKKREFTSEKDVLHELFTGNLSALEEFYNKLDEHQLKYAQAIKQKSVVTVDEKAGTGKTAVATMMGLNLLRDKESGIKKILYVRFASDRGEKLGATTGDLKDKEAKYMRPFIKELEKLGINQWTLATLEREGIIEMTTDASERGLTYENTFVIIDESQNALDIGQLRLILTRLDKTSKCVMIGHHKQIDSNIRLYGRHKLCAFQVYNIHMNKKDWTANIKLPNDYRGFICKHADDVDETLDEILQEDYELLREDYSNQTLVPA
jgi:phosphate starvation-inducible protein PhoH